MSRRSYLSLSLSILLLLLVELLFLVLQISPSRLFPLFLWPMHITPLHPLSLGGALFAAALLLAWRVAGSKITGISLVYLMIAFIAIQMGLAFMEGNGLLGLERRLMTTGHGSLAKATLKVEAPGHLLTHYEEAVEKGVLGSYGVTKAPGYFLPYWVLGRVARRMAPGDATLDELHEAQARLGALLLPLFSALFLIPLWFALRVTLPPEGVKAALLLALVIPNLQLMTLHADQFLLPTLAAFILLTLVYLIEKPGPLTALFTAFAFCLGLFFSLSLVVLLLYPLVLFFYKPRERFLPMIYLLISLFLLGGAGSWILHLNPIERFASAMRFHHHWSGVKLADLGHHGFLSVGISNLGEFLIWIGPLLAILTVASLVRWKGSLGPWRLTTLLILLQMAFLSGTVGESARLWLFILPFLLLFAGEKLASPGRESPGWFLPSLLSAQALFLICVKLFMDFV